MGSCALGTEASRLKYSSRLPPQELYLAQFSTVRQPISNQRLILRNEELNSINFGRPSQIMLNRQEKILVSSVRSYQQKTNNKLRPFSEMALFQEEPAIDREIKDEIVCKNATNLYQVKDTEFELNAFHQSIGALICQHRTKYNKFYGTAVLISPDLILTCAHNFYDKKSGLQYTKHRFYLGLNGKMQKYYQIQRFYYPEEYQIFLDPENDFAIAKLKTKVTEIKPQNYLNIGFGFKDLSAEISVFGYPSQNNYIIQKDGSCVAFQKGIYQPSVRSINKNQISYKAYTQQGQNGCPIVAGGRKDMIVGVHKGMVQQQNKISNKIQVYNIGRYVNLSMILRMEIWRQNCNAEKFRVVDIDLGNWIDLNSPLLVQMKRSLISEIQKNLRIKCIYDRRIQSSQKENGVLQEQNQQFANEIQSLKSELYIKDSELTRNNRTIFELKDRNGKARATINRFKETSDETLDLKRCLQELQNQLKTDEEKLKQKLLNQTNKPSFHQSLHYDFKIKWNKKPTYADNFAIEGNKLTKVIEKGKCQMTSTLPFPSNIKSKTTFKMVRYGSRSEICFGILSANRMDKENSGRNESSIGYFSNPLTRKGWVVAKGIQLYQQSQELFLPEGEQLQLIIDLGNNVVKFTNRYTRKSVFVELQQELRRTPVHAFCNLYCIGDTVEAV